MKGGIIYQHIFYMIPGVIECSTVPHDRASPLTTAQAEDQVYC